MASYTVYESNLRGKYVKSGTYDNWYAVVNDFLRHSVVLEDDFSLEIATVVEYSPY